MQPENSYQPNILGVTHIPEYARATILEISRILQERKVTKVGIEMSRYRLNHTKDIQNPYVRDHFERGNKFWKEVIKFLHERKVRVIYLISDPLAKGIMHYPDKKFGREVGGFGLLASLDEYAINSEFGDLVKVHLTNAMRNKAINAKPELIINGSSHAHIIREQLHIPQKLYHLVPKLNLRAFEAAQGAMKHIAWERARQQQLSKRKQSRNPKIKL